MPEINGGLIGVQAQTASLVYRYKDAEYLLNLIDTPGHVDFSYEVSRSLAACQGALLLVDAAQGIQVPANAPCQNVKEAQLYMGMDSNSICSPNDCHVSDY